MGSGHFLVSLVDRLTNHALDAIAEARALVKARFPDLDYESPVAEEVRKVRATIRGNAQDAGWAVSEEQLDDPQLVKRMVLKRCVYGADKNPRAVELAKVALWLHTFTVGAPLSFIDHHLAAGDSLFGLWVRDAIDKAGKGGQLFLHEPLSNAQRQAVVMRTIETLTDAEVAEAHRSAEMWKDVEAQTGALDGFVSFMHALDWLDLPKPEKALVPLWLDGRFGDPIAIARGRLAPEGGKARADEVERFTAIWRAARELIDEERFLNWQITFPGVWDNWSSAPDSEGRQDGGFDAIVGNPPWDRFEFEEVPWFEARDKTIALAPSGAKRKAAIKALKDADSSLWTDYQKALGRMAMATRVAKGKLIYCRLNNGKLNLYKLFVERAHSLVKPGGMVGLLTPSGIASDLSASEFFRKVATGGHLKALYDFENRRTRHGLDPFFPDVDSRFKFAAMIASPSRTFPAAQCGFFLQSVAELKNPEQAFPITAADFARVNPNTGTAPIFRTRRDMALTTAIYDRCPVLVDRSGAEPEAAWPVKYWQMINMTSDSHLFRTRTELEGKEGAWPVGGNRWQSAAGEWVPLYEGKMVQAFDHRAASVVVNPENLNRPAQPLQATPEQSADPNWLADPQFWVAASVCEATARLPWVLGFKEITAPTNVRTFIAAGFPAYGFGNKVPILTPTEPNVRLELLLANFNAMPFDFAVRQKVQGQTLNWFIVEQLPVIPPAAYGRQFGPKTAAEIVKAAVLELTYTAHDMAPFAQDMGHVDDAGGVLPPFIWDEDRRLKLRAKLDALYFILYGLFDPADPAHDPAQARDDIRYIYSTFPIVERQETERWGRYRSRDLCLSWINALAAGQPDAEVDG
ncbi:Eco57I restriction-modification methylase domain-containing protein [Sandaracinobacter sp.]|uniref:Eco57I restriction-modification methylase domain-containing protein n=1 Tax=Sandaracinobacter sp. TaxID=2487581 RepID=UPI0035AEECE8